MDQLLDMGDCEFDQQYHFSHLVDQKYFTLHESETASEHIVLQRTPSFGSYSSYPMISNTNFNTSGVTSLTGCSVEIMSPKPQTTNNWTSSIMTTDFQSSSSSPRFTILSFETSSASPPAHSHSHSQMLYGGSNDQEMGNFNVQTLCSEDSNENYLQDFILNYKANQLRNNSTAYPMAKTTTPSQGQPDHVVAERKRREKLNQRFIALSAVIPGLVKMDKATVLGEAIKYVKQLQERVQVLEEQTKKRTVESVVLLKKSQLSSDNESSSSDDAANGQSYLALPDVEARASDKEVLIRVQCQKQHRVLVKILNEIEKLHLSIVSISVLPFGTSILDITVISQMNDDFLMTMNDLVKNLRPALLKFMCPVSFSTH